MSSKPASISSSFAPYFSPIPGPACHSVMVHIVCRGCSSTSLRSSPVLLFLLTSASLIAAVPRTVIIDDTYGDAVTGALPVYAPSTSWTRGKPCVFDEECFVDPDAKQVRSSTWHDSVGKSPEAPTRTIDLTFQGNSIGVYCMISEVDRVEIAVANMTFELDGEKVGEFFHDPDGSMDASGEYILHYNVPVYQNTSIPQGKHSLRVSSVGYSRMLFDYAQYTSEDESASLITTAPSTAGTEAGQNSSSPRAGTSSRPGLATILGVVGGVVGCLVIGLLAFLLIRRRRRLGGNKVHRIDILKHERRFYGKDDVDSRSYMSLPDSESVVHERPASPFTYTNLSNSHFREDPEDQSACSSPTESIPLIHFPTPTWHADSSLPHIVVTGTETHLVGPDNSIARYARQQVSERETELTRRMREMEAALVAKYRTPAPLPSADAEPTRSASAQQSTVTRADSVRSAGSGLEAALREQLDELKMEMEHMRAVQQQLALELRDATEQPPEYQ